MKRKEAREKAKELVSQMTLEEKIGQLRSIAPAIERLGVPEYNWWSEALHGVARAGQATIFPQAIGLAATFDEKLIEEAADAISTEARAKYNAYSSHGDRGGYQGLTFWAPNVNIFRDPRWGRGHETYGEDPYLTSQIGKAFVRGMQGEGETLKTAACAKHFAAHSGPEGVRHKFDAVVSPKDMEETYLPAFEALVKEAKVEAVMGAYNRLNGVPCCANEYLIRELLRSKWGFEGHFLSDCLAILNINQHHQVTSSAKESAALALNAGCELNCGDAYLKMPEAYHEGLVTEETITEAAVSLFTTRYLLGMFDGSEYDGIPYEVVECKEHLTLSEKAAAESFVLLKNDGLLPLKKKELKTVAVIGPNAFRREPLVGNYHGTASEYVTVLDGVREYLGEDVRVLYSQGCEMFGKPLMDNYNSEAVIVAEHSDVVILCVGLDETLEGEAGDAGNAFASGDKINLSLPDSQVKLMEDIAKTGKPVILCLLAGSDIDLSFAAEHFQAIIQVWYPGAQGGRALAKVLFGEISAFGKLPVTFYETVEELPDFEDYSMKGRTYRYMGKKAQYPFGFGLNYGDVSVTEAFLQETGRGMSVDVTLTNAGSIDTEEIVQLYVKHRNSEYATKNPALCAFKRVYVKAGACCQVKLDVTERAFTVVDEEGRRFTPGGVYDFYVGCGQPDERTEELTGKKSIKLTYVHN